MKTRMKILGMVVGLLMIADAQAQAREECFIAKVHQSIPQEGEAIGFRLERVYAQIFAAHMQNLTMENGKVVAASEPFRTFAPLTRFHRAYEGFRYLNSDSSFSLFIDHSLSMRSHAYATVDNQVFELITVKSEFSNFCGGLK